MAIKFFTSFLILTYFYTSFATPDEHIGLLTEADFHVVVDEIELYYSAEAQVKFDDFDIKGFWSNSPRSLNVQGNIIDDNVKGVIRAYGGPNVFNLTKDGFRAMACFGAGVLFGGAPVPTSFPETSFDRSFGQSVYFITLRCLRGLFENHDNRKWADRNIVDPIVREKCNTIYASIGEISLCERASMAGFNLVQYIAISKGETVPSFETPSDVIVSKTEHRRIGNQCMLDTILSGALCKHDINQKLSDTDPHIGTCSRANGSTLGARPLCWYKPTR